MQEGSVAELKLCISESGELCSSQVGFDLMEASLRRGREAAGAGGKHPRLPLCQRSSVTEWNLRCRSVTHLPPGTKFVFADKIIQGLIVEGEEKCRLVIP